jgi:hypothetical protein
LIGHFVQFDFRFLVSDSFSHIEANVMLALERCLHECFHRKSIQIEQSIYPDLRLLCTVSSSETFLYRTLTGSERTRDSHQFRSHNFLLVDRMVD